MIGLGEEASKLCPPSSAGIPLLGCAEVCPKLVVQSELNTTVFLVNLAHTKLIERHVAKAISEGQESADLLERKWVTKRLLGFYGVLSNFCA
jgi:hypothetical protein